MIVATNLAQWHQTSPAGSPAVSQETEAKEEQLASMATAKADLESLAEEREAQLDASRRAGEKKEQELQAMQ